MVSTLSSTGDMRTGRQLLSDASKDHFRSVAGMAASQSGRAELNRMAKATEALARLLHSKREAV
jgi:hypothetical protein